MAVAASQNQLTLKPPVAKSSRKVKSRGGSPAHGDERDHHQVVDKREYVD